MNCFRRKKITSTPNRELIALARENGMFVTLEKHATPPPREFYSPRDSFEEKFA